MLTRSPIVSGRYDFTGSFIDADSGVVLASVDCEVAAEIKWQGNDPVVVCDAVWIDGINLVASRSPHTAAWGCSIIEQAEASEAFCEAVLTDQGVAWQGRGANDPDGRWRVAR